LANSRREPLDVQKFFAKPNISILLLMSDEIKFEIKINTPKNSSFMILPMIPNRRNYFIKKISSSTRNFKDIFNSFITAEFKLFIQSIEAINENNIIPGLPAGKQTIEKVIISSDDTDENLNKVIFSYIDDKAGTKY